MPSNAVVLRVGCVAHRQNACLASTRHTVQSPVQQPKLKKKKRRKEKDVIVWTTYTIGV
jgi:hypothetical protein